MDDLLIPALVLAAVVAVMLWALSPLLFRPPRRRR